MNSYISIKFKETSLKYSSAVHGINKLEQRWRRCVYRVRALFDVAVGAMLARSEKPNNGLKEAKYLAESIKFELESITDRLQLETVDRDELLRELRGIELIAGYPKEYFNDSDLEKYYEGLEIFEGEYFRSALEVLKFLSLRSSEKYLKPIRETEWRSLIDADVVDSYYFYKKKYIFVHPKHLEPPFFDINLPSYINYAGLGCHVANLYGIAFFYKVIKRQKF